jgi:nickel-dependent lactate racemase
MKKVLLDLGRVQFPLKIPDHADILPMGKATPLSLPEEKIRHALKNPQNTPPLKVIVSKKLGQNPRAKAVVVISDNTRPVPYSGDSGILFPVIDEMIKAGLPSSQISILVATGTHRQNTSDELRKMLDPRIFSLDIPIIQHDSRDPRGLALVGKTELGGKILLNRHYMESDIKILTGLVESHFMGGASGGRKSICPGLMSESSIHLLHSGPVLSSPCATDLILEGNPVHQEALRIARMAGCDFIINVTLDSRYRVTGVFAGDMEKAFLSAFEKLKSYAAIPVERKYHLVLSHAGYVGVNHYQAAKGALTCVPLIQEGGICLLAALHTDPDPIGGSNYKDMMHLLKESGTEKFLKMITDPEWNFVPEQWEAQMWTRLFQKIPPQDLIYCTLDIPEKEFSWLPGKDARSIVPQANSLQELVEKSLASAFNILRQRLKEEPRVALLPDGPYGIPLFKEKDDRKPSD